MKQILEITVNKHTSSERIHKHLSKFSAIERVNILSPHCVRICFDSENLTEKKAIKLFAMCKQDEHPNRDTKIISIKSIPVNYKNQIK